MNFKVVKSLSISWLLVAMFFSTSFSQQYSRLKGVILDAESKESVPFATVAFLDRSFGVITNEDGSFSFLITAADSCRQIEVSCIGYGSKTIDIKTISLDRMLRLELAPRAYSIDEVEVSTKRKRGLSAKEIVAAAVRGIDENYPNSPFLLNGYYRDYLKVEDKYINLFEAEMNLQDNGFHTSDKQQTKIGIVYGAFNKEFPVDSNMITSYGDRKGIPYGVTGYRGGNEFYFLLVHNPIRNHLDESFAFIKRIKIEFLEDHRFELLGTEYIDSVLCYKIEINYIKSEQPEFATGSISGGSKRFVDNYKAVGNIYIQADNFRIHNLSYQVFFSKLKLWELKLSYKDLDGVFYLNYLSFNNLIEIPNYLNDSYFYLKNLTVDKNNKAVNLVFNNPVDSETSIKSRYYRLKFDGKRVKISNVATADTCVTLSIEGFEESLGSFELKYADRLNFNVRKIKDIFGNKVNDLKTVKAYQYREFFVNNASEHFEPILEEQLLDPKKSIILNDQVLAIPDSIFFNSPLIGRE